VKFQKGGRRRWKNLSIPVVKNASTVRKNRVISLWSAALKARFAMKASHAKKRVKQSSTNIHTVQLSGSISFSSITTY